MLELVKTIVGGRMMRRSTARSIAWNYAGHVYQIGINFGLTWYIVRHIAVAEYGLFLFVMSLSATLYLLDMGISNLLVQAYVAASKGLDKDRLNDLISTTFLLLTALGTVGVLIFAGIAAILPGPFNIPHQYLHEASVVFILAALVIQAGLPSIALQQVYQASHRFDRINQIQLLTSTVQILLSVLVLAAGFRIVALALVQCTVSILQLVLLALVLPASVPGARLSLTRFNWKVLKPLIRLSRWAFLNDLSGYLFELLAWAILGSLGSMKEAAIYGLATKLPKQLWNIMDKGASVTLPLLSKFWAEADQIRLQQTYLKTQKLIFGAMLPFVVLGCFVARPIMQIWAGSEYTGAALVMQFLLIGAITHASGYSSVQLLYASGQVKKAALISFWEYFISIACAPLLVSRYGAAGLAAGIAITQLFINWGWYMSVACKISGVSPAVLLRAVLGGLEWPLVALTAEIVLISSIWSYLSPFWLLIAALVSGCTYLGLWGMRTALPLSRDQMEITA